MKNNTRRDFIKSSAAIGSFFILPSGLRAKSPNSKNLYLTISVQAGREGLTLCTWLNTAMWK